MSRAKRRRAAREAEKSAKTDAVAALERQRKVVAIHEAAHAVVGVRLAVPVESIDIRPRSRDELEPHMLKAALPGQPVTGAEGVTKLVEGTAEQWSGPIADPDTRDRAERLAAMAAGGVVAEMEIMRNDLNDLAQRADFIEIGRIAAGLGLGRSSEEKPVRDFINAAYKRAEEVLNKDGRRGWRSVAAALLEREMLTGDEVRVLLAKELERSGS